MVKRLLSLTMPVMPTSMFINMLTNMLTKMLTSMDWKMCVDSGRVMVLVNMVAKLLGNDVSASESCS